jgi:hypothetical protein
VEEVDTAVMGPDGLRVDEVTREVLAGPRAQEVLDTLRRASLLPHSVFPLKWEDGFSMLLPHMAKFRSSTRVLATYARVLAEEGRMDEALDWCLVALRMSGHAASEPTIIAQLVSAAVQGVAFQTLRDIVSEAPVSPAVATRYEEYLRGLSPYATFRASIVAERAGVLDVYTMLEGEPDMLHSVLQMTGGAKGAPEFARVYCSPLARPLHKADQLSYLQYMQTALDTVDLPYRHAAPVLGAMETELGGAGGNVLAAALMPAYDRIVQKRDWSAAEINVCRVALALKAYKHTHDTYPATLAHLQETLADPLPTDPFSGEGFLYQPQGEGFKLYSIGGDLDDDGGAGPRDEGHDYSNCDIVWECVR